MSWLIALSFVVALGFGVWLGMPRRYDQSLEEIDRRMDEEGEHQKVRRHRTVFNLLQPKMEKGSHTRRRHSRKPFRMK